MATNTDIIVTIRGRDEASASLKSVGDQVKGLGGVIQETGSNFAEMVNKSKVASAAFSVALGALVTNIVSVASTMEQARVSFDTMLGSAEKGSKLLAEISDFAKKTPFDLPQVVEGSKRLLAYNIEAQNIIPTFEMLGNIAAGVGKDKLPNLILAFGQVKAATRLTGMELRQFTEAGVPLLDALVQEANKAGGQLVTMGGQSKKAKVDVGELNDKLAIAKQRLKEASSAGKTKESTLMSLRNTVQNYEQKLGSASKTQGTFTTRVKVTAAQMKEMISDGTVSFDQVQKALAGMTGEGGRFFNLMDKLSNTFTGRMSNLRDQLVRIALNIAGISTAAEDFGSVVKGGPFDILSQGAQKLLDAFNKLEPLVRPFVVWFTSNGVTMGLMLGIIAGGLLGVAVATIGFLAPLFSLMGILGAFGVAIGLVVEAFGGFQGIADGVGKAVSSIQTYFETINNVMAGYGEKFKGHFEAFSQRAYKAFNLDPSKISFGDFFTQLGAKIQPFIDNLGAQIKQGFTNAFKINFGEGGSITDVLGRLMGIITPLSDLFFRLLTPAIEAFKASIEKMKPQLDILLQQLGPILINTLQILAVVLGIIVGAFLALMSGIMNAVAMALPFVVQAFAGLAQFLSGIMDIIVGIFTLNWNQILTGVKAVVNGIWDVIVGVFGAVLGFIGGFIKGIISFFKNLYDVLIGHSIIPDLVNGILDWFTTLKDKAIGFVADLVSGVTNKFVSMASNAYNWGKDLIGNFLNGISQKLRSASGAVRSFLIDKLGIPSDLQFQTGGIVPGPIGSPVPIMAHGGEKVTPAPVTGGGGSSMGGGMSFTVQIGLYAGTETEKRNIARDLYSALLQVAASQNKTVSELMGG